MPQKPLSPSYARRIERALAKGKTLQQARGHRAQEHILRREREKIQFGGLTGDQIRQIRRWYGSTFNPTNQRRQPSAEQLIDFARANSYAGFSAFRQRWTKLRNDYTRQQSRGTYASRGEQFLEDMGEDMEDDFHVPDIEWLYYH